MKPLNLSNVKKILVTGDVCLDGYTEAQLKKFTETKVWDALHDTDTYVVINLEAPIYDGSTQNENKISLRNRSKFFNYIKFAHAYAIANNHIMDFGDAGLHDTIAYLKENNKAYFGAGRSLSEARKPLVVDLNGKKIGMLAYTCYSTNSETYANLSSAGPAPLAFEYIKEDIKKLKNNCDYLIILPHWGIENTFYPTWEQVNFARGLIDLGVDGIISSHPHVIQCYEVYNGKSIYYSLGNFLFNNFSVGKKEKYFQHLYNRESLIVEIEVNDKGNLTMHHNFLKMTDFVPEFVSSEEMVTPFNSNNQTFAGKTDNVDLKNYPKDLTLMLNFNGRSMQVINKSNPVDKAFSLVKETMKAKLKRKLLKIIRNY